MVSSSETSFTRHIIDKLLVCDEGPPRALTSLSTRLPTGQPRATDDSVVTVYTTPNQDPEKPELFVSCTVRTNKEGEKAPLTLFTGKFTDSFFSKHIKRAGLRVNAEQFAGIFERALYAQGEPLASPALEFEEDEESDSDEDGNDGSNKEGSIPEKLTLKLQYLKEDLFEINGDLPLKKKQCKDTDILALLWMSQQVSNRGGSAGSAQKNENGIKQPTVKTEAPQSQSSTGSGSDATATDNAPANKGKSPLRESTSSGSVTTTYNTEAVAVKNEVKKEENEATATGKSEAVPASSESVEVKPKAEEGTQGTREEKPATASQRAPAVKKKPPPMGLNPGKKRRVGGGAKIGGGNIK
eukprot:gb/GECG01012409.1/.p1 GENE.gb/GECG01012409.1/~~gb/GECG01012409.1/.p1  ORF type:complete len:355 (+),score=74.01 gb/GECG01012409.1/:1-1065(+)